MALSDTLSSRFYELILGLVVLYLSQLLFYRLLFHPLRHFPGDKLSALTKWTWDYHASDPTYLEKLHAKYGPVVRICPNELHFSDPRAYAQIYHSARKFTKDPYFYASFGQDESSFGFCDPHKAKIRKDIISPLFSRRAILKLESVVQDKIDILLAQLTLYKDEPANLSYAFRSTTLDIISSYCFAHSWSPITYPKFQHPIILSMDEATKLLWLFDAFPLIKDLVINLPTSLPDWIVHKLPVPTQGLFTVKSSLTTQIDNFLSDPLLLKEAEHETVYHHLMTPRPDKGQPNIPSRKSLLDEAQLLMMAGSDTVGHASTTGVFYVLNDARIHRTLLEELERAWPDKSARCNYETLEKLPYLTAVIKESLRVSYGVVSPLPRVVGPESTEINGLHIPKGTTVSMSATFLHNDPETFPRPMEFKPERWLQPHSRELENYLVSFSKGPRSCLGVNLAWCELYLILGNVFRKLDMEIYNTTADDFKYKAYFLPSSVGRHFHAIVKKQS